MIQIGSKVKITKGCKQRNIKKGMICTILDIKDLGAEGSYFVNIKFRTPDNKVIGFYMRYMKRLSDPEISLNDGNPFNKIEMKEVI